MGNYISQRLSVISTGVTTTGDLTGQTIDLASAAAGGGYYAEGVLCIAHGSTNTTSLLKFQTGTASDAMSDTTGDVAHTLGTLYGDHQRPTKRFIRGVLTAGGATGEARVLVTIPYGLRQEPPTFPASTTGFRVTSPGSGTATG